MVLQNGQLVAATPEILSTIFGVHAMARSHGNGGLILRLSYAFMEDSNYEGTVKYAPVVNKELSVDNPVESINAHFNATRNIPTIQYKLDKELVDLRKMEKSNVMNCIDSFINYARQNMVAVNEEQTRKAAVPDWCNGVKLCLTQQISYEANKIAVRSRRGSANTIIIHPDNKDVVSSELIPTHRYNIVLSETMKKDELLMLYNGEHFYDGAVQLAVSNTKFPDINIKEYCSGDKQKEFMATADKWMLCVRDDFQNYCTLLKI